MNEYIMRLIRCGYSPDEAYKTYYSFLKEFSLADFLEFVAELEKDVRKCG
jgi:hypothetical protein